MSICVINSDVNVPYLYGELRRALLMLRHAYSIVLKIAQTVPPNILKQVVDDMITQRKSKRKILFNVVTSLYIYSKSTP